MLPGHHHHRPQLLREAEGVSPTHNHPYPPYPLQPLAPAGPDAYLTPIATATSATETNIDAEDSSFVTTFRVPTVVSAGIQSGDSIEVRSHVRLNATVSVRRALALCGHARTVHDLLAHAQHAVEAALRASATVHIYSEQDALVRVELSAIDEGRGEAVLSAEIEYHAGTHPRSSTVQDIHQAFDAVQDLCAGAARAIVPVRSNPPDPASSVVTAPPLQRQASSWEALCQGPKPSKTLPFWIHREGSLKSR